MLPPKKTRDLARSLVASEADASKASLQTEPATVRVYEKLRRQLGSPMGVDGFQSLASRALALAKSQSPRLGIVQVTPNGDLRGFDEVESQSGTDEDDSAGGQRIRRLPQDPAPGCFAVGTTGSGCTGHLVGLVPHLSSAKTCRKRFSALTDMFARTESRSHRRVSEPNRIRISATLNIAALCHTAPDVLPHSTAQPPCRLIAEHRPAPQVIVLQVLASKRLGHYSMPVHSHSDGPLARSYSTAAGWLVYSDGNQRSRAADGDGEDQRSEWRVNWRA